ncbi:MAG: hypothetical protein FWC76_01565 [Defluviitaleaceae bacterium]|nr:hypothetical protein [Defluviitaleaceae bacterium]
MLLLFIPSTATLSADEAYDGTSLESLQTQLQLLEEFLEGVKNPRMRTGFEDVFSGDIFSSPIQPINFFDGKYDNCFLVVVMNHEDLYNYELKEVLSSATGIPPSRIAFLWLDLENVMRHEPPVIELTLDWWFTYHADIMIDLLRDDLESVLEYRTLEEIAAAVEYFEDKLAERGVKIIVDEAITVEELPEVRVDLK